MLTDEQIERYQRHIALKEVGGNPFSAALEIKAWEASQYEAISNFFKKEELNTLVEKVDYYQRKPVIERIYSLTDFFNKTGIIISLFLALVAILVTFNTIRLAIYNFREEIKIQRLVGASNWFIRGPFLAQGAIAGIFAALISLAIFILVCWFLSPKIKILFSDLIIFNLFLQNFWKILAIQFFTGIGLGIISSLIAIRKYLKV